MINFQTNRLREYLQFIIKKAGFLPTVIWFLRLKMLLPRRVRLAPGERQHWQRFLEFKRQYGNVLRHRLNNANHEQKIALVSSPDSLEVEMVLGLIKALELAGFTPVVLLPYGGKLLYKYFRMAGVKNVHFWRDLAASPDFISAEAVLERFQSVQELLKFEYSGTRVGRLAMSTALRRLKLGSLELRTAQDRKILVEYLASAMAYAEAAPEES